LDGHILVFAKKSRDLNNCDLGHIFV